MSANDMRYGENCPKGMVQVEFVGVDPECAKLAEYFMADEHKHIAKRASELADHIQQAIEDWFYTVKHEERTPD